jgi:rod shape-determining protein MreC
MCEVASRGGMGGWWQTLQLNKGLEHGVGAGMAVMTMEGLIGRTGEAKGETDATGGILVSQRTADVLLLTDPNCRVSCRLPRTGGLGIVRGRGASLGGDADLEMLCNAEPCHMDFIPKGVKIQVGDEVVTSGLGGVYPEGLLVGTVQEVSTDKSGLYQRAEVAAAASLTTVKYAFVVIPEEPKERKPTEDQTAPEVREPVTPPTRPPPEMPTGTEPRIPTYKRVLPPRTNTWEGAGNP